MCIGIDIEMECCARLAIGRTGHKLRAVGHDDFDHVIIGMNVGLHRLVLGHQKREPPNYRRLARWRSYNPGEGERQAGLRGIDVSKAKTAATATASGWSAAAINTVFSKAKCDIPVRRLAPMIKRVQGSATFPGRDEKMEAISRRALAGLIALIFCAASGAQADTASPKPTGSTDMAKALAAGPLPELTVG